MVYRLDEQVLFKPLSAANMELMSLTSSAGDLHNGWSIQRNFTPLFSFDPLTTDNVLQSRAIATIISAIFGPGNPNT